MKMDWISSNHIHFSIQFRGSRDILVSNRMRVQIILSQFLSNTDLNPDLKDFSRIWNRISVQNWTKTYIGIKGSKNSSKIELKIRIDPLTYSIGHFSNTRLHSILFCAERFIILPKSLFTWLNDLKYVWYLIINYYYYRRTFSSLIENGEMYQWL